MSKIKIKIKLKISANSSDSSDSSDLDKFYTIPSVAKKCIDITESIYRWDDWELVVEPSAGNGSFFLQLPTKKCIGIDILPEHDGIIKQDFLTYHPDTSIKNILVIGNPPFGRVSSTAIKFFNHSSQWANTIAFIVPRTFRRISVQNKLNLNFKLIHDTDIPTSPCSFYPQMMAKCCFQIWERSQNKRNIINLPTSHPHWIFLNFGEKDSNNQPTPPLNADFAIRAYGGKCGEIVTTNLGQLRPKSWHWIKSNIDSHVLISNFNKLDYTISLNTARQNSIGKGELVNIYSQFHDG